jgi:hypothetical protein
MPFGEPRATGSATQQPDVVSPRHTLDSEPVISAFAIPLTLSIHACKSG